MSFEAIKLAAQAKNSEGIKKSPGHGRSSYYGRLSSRLTIEMIVIFSNVSGKFDILR